jgi:hypothetical protein
MIIGRCWSCSSVSGIRPAVRCTDNLIVSGTGFLTQRSECTNRVSLVLVFSVVGPLRPASLGCTYCLAVSIYSIVGRAWYRKGFQVQLGLAVDQKTQPSRTTNLYRPIEVNTPQVRVRILRGPVLRMVYPGGPSKGCYTCRARKVKVRIPFNEWRHD